MDNGLHARLLYEWNTEKAHLDFTIAKAELQLVNVNKRLQRLRQDLLIYSGMLVLPLLLIFLLLYILGKFLPTPASYVLYVLVAGFTAALVCVYMMAFPFFLFYLIKAISLNLLNREDPKRIKRLLPPETRKRHKETAQEATYRIEQQKLIHVLSRYYLYQDTMEQLRPKIESASISLEELRQELKQFTYYETIYPANGFTGPMMKKARNTVFIVLSGVIAGIAFLVFINR